MITLLATATLAAAPLVNYIALVESRDWEPIEPKDLELLLENAVIPSLGTGDARYVKATASALRSGDYTLVVNGRFIDETEEFSVYLTFGPGAKTDLPSFHVSETTSIGRRPGSQMQKRITAVARKTADRLAKRLAPAWRSQELENTAQLANALVDAESLDWSFAETKLPAVRSPAGAAKTLLNVRNSDRDRIVAVKSVGSAAFDEAQARTVLERCVLFDPSPEVRVDCVEALGPVARQNVQVQRLVLKAMRNEFDDKVLTALTKVSETFSGLSLQESIDTWLYLIAEPATPESAARLVSRALRERGELPNLDQALARCLTTDNLAWQKKRECAGLLPNVPGSRRVTVARPYLMRTGIFSVASELVTTEVLRALSRLEDEAKQLGCDTVAEALRRPNLGSFRNRGLGHLLRCDELSQPMFDSAFAIGMQADPWNRDVEYAARVLGRVDCESPLREKAIAAVDKIYARLAEADCTPRPSRGDVIEDVGKVVERLRRQKCEQALAAADPPDPEPDPEPERDDPAPTPPTEPLAVPPTPSIDVSDSNRYTAVRLELGYEQSDENDATLTGISGALSVGIGSRGFWGWGVYIGVAGLQRSVDGGDSAVVVGPALTGEILPELSPGFRAGLQGQVRTLLGGEDVPSGASSTSIGFGGGPALAIDVDNLRLYAGFRFIQSISDDVDYLSWQVPVGVDFRF
ncbi:MAG: hypothetical protein AAF654_06895 [Myxococcota bacterium]